MSVFKVTLNNTAEGTLDGYVVPPASGPTTGANWAEADDYTSASTADTTGVSLQRQMYVAGPLKVNRLLKDGQVFTDCNYWKRFCYPQVPLEQAILTCVTDDGGIWVDGNTAGTTPKVYNLIAYDGQIMGYDSGASHSIANIYDDTGGYAVFCQITNGNDTDSVQVRINETATFTLEKSSAQVFNLNDLLISKVEVVNSASGHTQHAEIEVLCSVQIVPAS